MKLILILFSLFFSNFALAVENKNIYIFEQLLFHNFLNWKQENLEALKNNENKFKEENESARESIQQKINELTSEINALGGESVVIASNPRALRQIISDTKRADALDKANLYSEAYQLRVSSLKTFSSLSDQERFSIDQDVLKVLYIKLAWSAYRSEKYKESFLAIKNASKYHGKFSEKNEGVSYTNELERIGAMSWVAFKDTNLLKNWISQDDLNGSSRQILLNIFEYMQKDQAYSEIEKLADSTSKMMQASSLYPRFLELRFDALEKMGRRIEFSNLVLLNVNTLSQKSSWYKNNFQKFRSNDLIAQQNFFSKLAPKAYQYYLELAQQTGLAIYYSKCSDITQNVLEEPIAYLERGNVLSTQAECYLGAADLKRARDSALEVLKLRTDDIGVKNVYVLLIRIGEKETEKNFDFESEAYKRYEDAVDSYILKFPAEKYAREALLASALRRQKYNDFDTATLRFARLCTLIPHDESYMNEMDQCLVFWSRSSFENPSAQKASRDGAQVELLLRSLTYVSEQTTQKVTTLNASSLRRFGRELRKQGQWQQYIELASLWVEKFPKNKETPNILLELARFLATLQDWKNVEKHSEKGLSLYGYHESAQEFSYWFARSAEESFRFDTALARWKTFVKANPILENHAWLKDGISRLYRLAYIIKDDAWLTNEGEKSIATYAKTFALKERGEWLAYCALASSRLDKNETALKLARISNSWVDSKSLLKKEVEFTLLLSKLRISKQDRNDKINISAWIDQQLENKITKQTSDKVIRTALVTEQKMYFSEIARAQESATFQRLNTAIDDFSAILRRREKKLNDAVEVEAYTKEVSILNLMREEALRQLGYSPRADALKIAYKTDLASLFKNAKVTTQSSHLLLSQLPHINQEIDPNAVISLVQTLDIFGGLNDSE